MKTNETTKQELTTQDKELLKIIVKTLKEKYQEKLKDAKVNNLFKSLLNGQIEKFKELERKLT